MNENEKKSILGSLKWLKVESINQTGRFLASSRLDGRFYLNQEAPLFFSYCYELRSRLVHGSMPQPTREDIVGACAQLEVFVSDLLSGPFLEMT